MFMPAELKLMIGEYYLKPNYMKLFAAVLFGSLINYSGAAQVAAQNKVNPNDYKPYHFDLKDNVAKGLANKIQFVFFEEREDSIRMGFFINEDFKPSYLEFREPAVPYLSKIFNSREKKDRDTMYIGIKRLWLSQVYISSSLVKSILWNPRTQMGYSRVICNFYKRSGDNYFLIHAYDSVFSGEGYLANSCNRLLSENLHAMIRIADSLGKNTTAAAGVMRLTPKSKPPILTTERIEDGIYLGFEDFLKNRPVKIEFNYIVSKAEKQPPKEGFNHIGPKAGIKTEEKLVLAEPRADDSLYVKKCWGFCKNGIPYMRNDSLFSKLTRIHNTFELRASERLQFRHAKEKDAFLTGFNIGVDIAIIAKGITTGFMDYGLITTPPFGSPHEITFTMPFKLDLDTGEVY